LKALKVIHLAISVIHEWGTKYKDTPTNLSKKTRKEEKLEKVEVKILMHKKKLNKFVEEIIASYAWLYNGLESLVRTHKIPLVVPFSEEKGKNIIEQEIQEYLDSVKHVTTKQDLEINRNNMQRCIAKPAKVNMKLLLLQNEA